MNKAQKLFINYRKEMGLTQVEIARMFDISQATVSLIESGKTNPTAHIILTILSKTNKVKAA